MIIRNVLEIQVHRCDTIIFLDNSEQPDGELIPGRVVIPPKNIIHFLNNTTVKVVEER